MNYLFWIFIFLILFVYFGYPLVLMLLAALKHQKVQKAIIDPPITMVTAAYNEEAGVDQFIQNKLKLTYESDKYQLLLISDGSDDMTDQIIQNYTSQNITYLRQEPRLGKTAALNKAVPSAQGEIIVFADANSMYDPNALKHLVSNFADPLVGYVTGKMVYVNKEGDIIGDGCTRYMKYENWLRKLETDVGSIVGVDGGIDAVRKELYEEMPPDMQPDFVLPLEVIEKGYRVIYEEKAILKENALSSASDEFKMRVRVILRAWRAIWYKKNLLNPIKYGIFAFQFFSHKVLRYLAGFLQLGIFVSNIFLLDSGKIYIFLLVSQLIFYALAFIGIILEKMGKSSNILSSIYYFNLLNLASSVAFIQFLLGKKQVVWTPRKG